MKINEKKIRRTKKKEENIETEDEEEREDREAKREPVFLHHEFALRDAQQFILLYAQ